MGSESSGNGGGFVLGLVQMSCDEDRLENLKAAEEAVRSAAQQSAQIICFPELFATRYFCQVEDPDNFNLAEEIQGPTTARFCSLAAELGVAIVVPIFERRTAGIYHNSAVVIDNMGEMVGTYRKMHIPDDPKFFEKYYFSPGDLGYSVFDTPFARIGILICWDQWYPEAARLMALAGAEVILFPTAIGWIPEDRNSAGRQQLKSWRIVQQSHAIANGIFVATVNRVGMERSGADDLDGINFWGHSFVSDPSGRIIARADTEQPKTLIVRCERNAIEQNRRQWPFLRDRRIDSYENLTKRFVD